MALSYGCTGPMLRGSLNREQGRSRLGPAQDRAVLRLRDTTTSRRSFRRSRKRRPRRSSATAGTGSTCACCEVVESIKIVEQGLEKYADGPGLAPHRAAAAPAGRRGLRRDGMPARPDGLLRRRPAQPRTPVPLRVRARSSSFCNLSVTNEICRGCLIADVPAIVGSIDIVMGEIDR